MRPRSLVLACLIPILMPAALPAQDGGVLGATCSTTAYCPRSLTDKTNTCRNVKDSFYPGLLMVLAESAAAKACEQLNALDYCGTGAHGAERAQILKDHDGGCYDQCAKKTVCLYGDNR